MSVPSSTGSSPVASSRDIRARHSTCRVSRFSDNGKRVCRRPRVLRARLTQALSGLPLREDRLAPFLHDVEVARTAPPLELASLDGTSFAALVGALLVKDDGGWRALMPLEAPVLHGHARDIDIARVRRAVSIGAPDDVTVLDLKDQADALYSSYLAGAVRLSLAGFAAIVVLLLIALRRPSRVLRVVLPLALAVLTVAACLRLFGAPLTLLHVVGMLLIVAVGSNYALFFDKRFSSSTPDDGGAGPGRGRDERAHARLAPRGELHHRGGLRGAGPLLGAGTARPRRDGRARGPFWR